MRIRKNDPLLREEERITCADSCLTRGERSLCQFWRRLRYSFDSFQLAQRINISDRHEFGTDILHRYAVWRNEWRKRDVLTMRSDRDRLFRIHLRPAPGRPEWHLSRGIGGFNPVLQSAVFVENCRQEFVLCLPPISDSNRCWCATWDATCERIPPDSD